jgi:hypothetical protein
VGKLHVQFSCVHLKGLVPGGECDEAIWVRSWWCFEYAISQCGHFIRNFVSHAIEPEEPKTHLILKRHLMQFHMPTQMLRRPEPLAASLMSTRKRLFRLGLMRSGMCGEV